MQLQQLDSGSQAQPELLVLWLRSELVPLALVGPAALVLVEAALVLVEAALVVAAAPVADRLGKERRMGALAAAAAGREGAGAELRGGCGGQTGRGRMKLEGRIITKT